MKANLKKSSRLISFVLCLAMILSFMPIMSIPITAVTDTPYTTVSDQSTLNAWTKYFGKNNDVISTEYAGGIWTDKSVFDNDNLSTNTELPTVSLNENENFLVALSAIGSNETVSGNAHVPTDTIFVLDLSRSMNGYYDDLVDATNEAIKALFAINPHNRVGIAVYSSAESSKIFLPLDRYNTTNTNGNFITYTNDRISVLSGVTNSAGETVTGTANPSSGTYTQLGTMLAAEFLSNVIDITVNDPTLGTVTRKPAIVLMTDGEPTRVSKTFTAPNANNIDYSSTQNPDTAILNQLTASYANKIITENYGDCLFYTLAYRLSIQNGATLNESKSYVASILDPLKTGNYTLNTTAKSTLDAFWVRYDSATTGSDVGLASASDRDTVTKIDGLDRNYVDGFFTADSNNLTDVFKNIVSEIEKASEYHPTLIGGDANLSGYISFVDKIGEYMNVKSVKGIVINNTLFSGAELGYYHKTYGQLPDGMIESVMARLNVSQTVAQDLIDLSHSAGQLNYNSNSDYSNYIGWYAKIDSATNAVTFLGFYNEGTTTAPQEATHKIRSYGYLGETTQGVAESDLMYAVVQVREEIATREQTVVFSVPANILPTVTYNIDLDKDNNITELTVESGVTPIRLLYEVGLWDEINEFNITDIVAPKYINKDGTVSLYTNQYETSGDVGYGKVNTYAYFRPSKANSIFYFTSDAPIYNSDGSLYVGETNPATGYHKKTIYKNTNGSISQEYKFEPISSTVLNSTETIYKDSNNNWYVKQNTVHTHISDFHVVKDDNVTQTLKDVKIGFVDVNNHNVYAPEYSFVVGYTLGNNGKITVTPETGLWLEKTVADGDINTEFIFTINNLEANKIYAAYRFTGTGASKAEQVTAENGVANVTLKHGESLFIGGLTAGSSYTVTEVPADGYQVKEIKVNNETVTTENSISVSVEANKFTHVEFTNETIKYGDVSVSKKVTHEYGDGYVLPSDKRFEITLTFPTELAGKTFTTNSSMGGTQGEINVDANAQATISLKHNETLTIHNLPVGTVVYASETLYNGFTTSYAPTTASATVTEGTVSNITVTNAYTTPAEIKPNTTVTVSGTKTYDSWTSRPDDTFTVELYQVVDGEMIPVQNNGTNVTATLTTNSNEYLFNIPVPTAIGTYYYHVVERNDKVLGVNYDATVHHIVVEVTDTDMDGYLEVNTITMNGTDVQKTSEIDQSGNETSRTFTATGANFTNTYSLETTTASIVIEKHIENNIGSPVSAAGFSFNIKKGTETETVTTGNGGEAIFTDTYDTVGTYEYIITEVNDGRTGWYYDSNTHTVVVAVAAETNNALYVESITVDGNAVSSAKVAFTNTYDPVDATIDVNFIRKILNGRNILSTDAFTFKLYNADDDISTATPILTKTIAGDNTNKELTFSLGELSYDKVGTYSYKIIEETGSLGGITYDKTEKYFSVTVTDNNGTLEAKVDGLQQGTTIDFVNTYKAEPVEYTISGTKALTGRNLIANEFKFVLTGSIADGEVPKTWTATNDAAGNFSFDSIKFEQAGTYYFTVVEENNGLTGITYDTTPIDVTVTVTDNGLGNLVIASVETASNGSITFTNTFTPSPINVTISAIKTMIGRELNAGEFTFELYGDLNSPYIQSKTNDADGSVTFDQIAINAEMFENGAREIQKTYFIKEVSGNAGGITYDTSVYAVTVTATWDEFGNLSADVSYSKNGNPVNSAVFENHYSTGSVMHAIDGIKVLNGRPITANDKFEFILKEVDENGNTFDGAKHWTNHNDSYGNFSFPEIEYKLGTNETEKSFYYTVNEIEGVAGGINYDKTEYFVTITITDNEDGTITLTEKIETIENGTKTNAPEILFTNEYTTGVIEVVVFDATKKLNGEVTDKEFSFNIYMTNASGEYTERNLIKTTTNDIHGKIDFVQTYDKATEEYYLIKEVNEGKTGYTYDANEYLVEVVITDDGEGNLNSTVKYYNKENLSEPISNGIVFENTYTPDSSDTEITVPGIKEFNATLGEVFTFELVDASGTVIKTATVTDKGNFGFDFGPFESEQTLVYTAREKTGTNSRITYDTTKYLLTITVTDNNGTLEAAYAITKNGETAELKFVNTYRKPQDPPTPPVTPPAPTSTTIIGTKTIIGDRKVSAGEFMFDLYEADRNFNKIGDAIQTVTNGTFGSIVFKDITFSEAGIYRFIVKENASFPIEGIIYDRAEFHVTVDVRENGYGSLYINSQTISRAIGVMETQTKSILFENIYMPNTVSTTVSGNKILIGRELKAGEFKFTLTSEDGTSYTAYNKADGSFTFDALSFNKTGTYKFTVTEVSDDEFGMIYDTSIYNVTVKVFDSGNDRLVTNTTIEKLGEGKVSGIVFENKYDPEYENISVDVVINKTVENIGYAEIGPENFEFVIENIITGDKFYGKTDTTGKAIITLTFDEEDIDTQSIFTLKEVNDGRDFVEYSTEEHTILVSTYLDENNELVVFLGIDGKAVNELTVNYTNIFNFDPIVEEEPEIIIPDTDDDDRNHVNKLSTVLFAFCAIAVAGGFGFKVATKK